MGIAALLSVLGIGPACTARRSDAGAHGNRPGEGRSVDANEGEDAPNGAVHIIHLAFEVHRADIPVRDNRESRKVWNHVDELRFDPVLANRLIRNGIRAGVMNAQAWPAVQTVLEAARARSQKQEILVQSGVPLTIIVDSVDEGESMFSFSETGGWVGRTFQGGNKLLIVDYSFRPALGGCTDVGLSLEVRRDLGTAAWERVGETIRQVRACERHVFSDLALSATLSPHEYLVIGPSGQVDRNYLVGSRFFTDEDVRESEYETFYFITPSPYREPLRG